MGVPILVMGFSGSGKSSSLMNFEPDCVGVFSVAGKRLPFKADLPVVDMERLRAQTAEKGRAFDPYTYMKMCMKSSDKLTFVIDDSQYLMGFEEMDSTLKGFDKFNSIGFNFVGLVRFVRSELPDDVAVYFLHHVEREDDGRLKPKTIGKLIDNHYTLEGLFEVCIMSVYQDGGYVFVTSNNGVAPLKNPPGMLDDVMDNDLCAVDDAIRDYWGMAPRRKGQS